MAALPTGTVTFLFTDIAGSTGRWEHDRAAMSAALARHNAILDRAVAGHAGHVFKTVGDAYCAAFAHATDAVEATIAAQRALHTERWDEIAPGFAPLAVRMGLHTGLVQLQDGDYVGRPVNRVARLMAAAAGGQVLLSLATQQLVRDALPKGCELIDLGVHRLKDLDHTEHLFRLVAPGFPDVATPPDTAEALPAGTRAPVDLDALPAACPYRGLHAFREEDAAWFFGREAFTELLVESVAATPMVGVIGPSGSGKSSVVFAGLVPRLRAGGNGGSTSTAWTVVDLRPGGRPYHALAGAVLPLYERAELTATERLAEINRLAGYLRDGTIAPADILTQIGDIHPDLGRILLVADQFEELYTLCPDEAEHRAFQDLLFAAAFEPNGGVPLTLALTLRADFMGHALAYRPFADAIQKHDVKLGPMTRDELARAVRLPAEAQGRAFESGLVERIVDDVGEKAGTLPLLEFALTRLWEQQRGGWLTHEAYEAIGRVEGAVARHADAVYEGLLECEQERTRRVIVQLVQPGEGTEDTRRIATREELGDDWLLVRRLADSRLVTTGRDEAGHETAEVVHEALIRSWQRLREWMNADRRFRAWQERLRFGQRQWEDAGRDEGALLRGVPLAEAEQWVAERGGEMAAGEREYVAAGRALRARRESERQAQEDQRRRFERRATLLTRAIAALAVFGMIAGLGLAWYANGQRQNSDAAALDAQRTALVARSQQFLSESRGDEALAVALEAVLLPGVTAEAELALSHAAYAPGTLWETAVGDREGQAVALSPDGRLVATANLDGTVLLLDARSGAPIRTVTRHSAAAESVVFSPDGRSIAAAFGLSADGNAEAPIEVCPVAEAGEPVRFASHTSGVDEVRFLPGGRRLLSVGDDGALWLWDVGKPAEGRRVASFGEYLTQVDVDSAGTRAVVGGLSGVVSLVDIASGSTTVIAELGGTVQDLAFSPDGRSVAVAVSVPRVRVELIDLAPPHQARALPGNGQTPLSVTFFPDSTRVLVGSNGSALEVIDTASGIRGPSLVGHGSGVSGAVVDASGLRAYAVDWNGRLRAWAPFGAAVRRRILAHPGSVVRALAFDPRGETLASGSYTGSIKLWTMDGDGPARDLPGHGDIVRRLAFSHDGTRLVSASKDTHARVWDLAHGETVLLLPHRSEVWAAGFSSDDSLVFTGSFDGTFRVWDGATGAEVRRFHPGRAVPRDPEQDNPPGAFHTGEVRSAALSANDRLAATGISATGPEGGFVVVWDMATGDPPVSLRARDVVNQVLLDPDAGAVTGAVSGRRMLRWSLEHPATDGSPDEAYDFYSQVFDLAGDGTGSQLALGTNSGEMLMWDIARQAAVRRYPAGQNSLTSIALSPATSMLSRGTDNGWIEIFDVHRSLAELVRWALDHRLLRDYSCPERQALGLPGDCHNLVAHRGQPGAIREIAEAALATGSGPGGLRGAAAVMESLTAPGSHTATHATVAQGAPVGSGAPTDGRLDLTALPEQRIVLDGVPVINGLAAAPGGDTILVARSSSHFAGADRAENVVEAVSRTSGLLLGTWRHHTRGAWFVVPRTSDSALVTAADDNTIAIARWDEPAAPPVVIDIGESPYDIAVSETGNLIVYGTATQLGVLERDGGGGSNEWSREVVTRTKHAVTAVALHPDNRRVIAGSGDGSLWLIDRSNPTQPRQLLKPDPEWGRIIRTAAFSLDGQLAAAAGDSGVLTLWDRESASVRRQYTIGDVTIYDVLFSPNGRYLATSDDDGIVRLFDLHAESDQPIRLLGGHASSLVPIDFLDGGCRLVSGDLREVRIWDLKMCDLPNDP